MIKLKKSEKIIIIVSAVILLFLIPNMFLSRSKNRLKGVGQQIKLEEAAFKKYLEIQRQKEIIMDDYKTYQGYLKMEKADEQQIIPELLKEVERLAKDAGLSIINLVPQETKEQAKGALRNYKADLRIEATLEQIFNFIYKIQENKLLIKIDKITLVPKDEAASSFRGDATISIAIP